MTFLRQEVQGEEMVVLSRTGFASNNVTRKKEYVCTPLNERLVEIRQLRQPCKKLDQHLSVKNSPSTITLSNQCSRDRTVYLQTLCVIARGRGRERRIRIILDSASQYSHVSERFINNSRVHVEERELSELSSDDIENAERVLIRLVQDKMFPNLKSIPIVNVFKDNEGIIRVKTKITERKDDPNFIAPILMPSKCLLTTRLIEYYHLKHCHAGVQILMSILHEKFWIMKTRKTVREVVMKCVHCRRYSSNSPMSEPVSLPADRVKDANAFDITGIDLAGPLFTRDGGKAILTYEELLTVLCDCEAVVNSRPLTYVSEDPNDLIPLTPSFVFKRKSSYDTVDLDLSEFSKFQKRIKYRRKLIHDFRSRFRKEYLGQLRQKTTRKARS
ncbi:integrase catalytic domain-containing protein [Trichonephila clavipes]|nr:integrase catalytic domain-containing protein [Trichonephila clavipes]